MNQKKYTISAGGSAARVGVWAVGQAISVNGGYEERPEAGSISFPAWGGGGEEGGGGGERGLGAGFASFLT